MKLKRYTYNIRQQDLIVFAPDTLTADKITSAILLKGWHDDSELFDHVADDYIAIARTQPLTDD